jgi:hypothetical protein
MLEKERLSRDPELGLYLGAKLSLRRRFLCACYVEFDNSGDRDE